MAQPAVIQLEVESEDALAVLEQVEQGLEEVDIAAVEAGDGFERLTAEVTEEVAESRTQIQSMASATRDMASASSTANNLTFELTNQLQDMRAAGLRGATNAIPMISEQFLRLQDQAGSTTGALSQMLSTFTGPTGILAIGTLGLQALPSVINFFSGVREEAEKTAEEVESLKEATDQLITGFESELPDFQIADAGQARQSVEALEQSIQSREQLIEDLEEALGAAGAEQAQLSRGAARFANLADQTIQKLIRRNERVIEQERGLRRAIQERLDRREDEVGQVELLKGTQGVVVKQSQDRVKSAQDSADATEREAKAMNALAVSAKEVAENRQAVNQFFAQGGRRERLFRQFSLGRTPTVGGTMLNQGQSQGALMLQSARRAGIISQFQDFPELLERIQQKTEDAGNEARDSFQDPLATGIQLAAQFGTTLEQAFDQGIEGADEFAKTILPILGQIIGAATSGPVGAQVGGGIGQILALPLAEGGLVRGEGGTTEDRIPAMLSDREFVVRAASAQMAPGALQAINEDPTVAGMVEQLITSQDVEQFAAGGMVGASPVLSAVAEGGEPALAKVHPPELMMNGEERIIGREETKAILKDASGGAGSEALAHEMRAVRQAVTNLQLTADSSGIHLASQDFQSELERTGARMYPAP